MSVSSLQGATANFGLAHLDTRIRTVGGLVFLDCNENGIQDLQVEFDRRPPTGAYEVTLERLDGRNSQTPTTSRQNRYSFDSLDSGSYVVSLRISDARFKATTSTRREVTIGTTFGAVADFGIVDTSSNSACARAANETATVVLGTATAVAGNTATAVEATSAAVVATAVARGGAPGGPVLPPQTATAVAAAAAATAARLPTSTAIPTATPIPTARLERAYPRSARFTMQAIARYPDGRRIDMLAEGALIGLETIIFQDAGQRVGSEQLSMRIKRNERVDDIVVTAQEAYRQRDSDDFWRSVPYAEVRNELGLLAPLDALVALRCISRGQEGGQAIVDGIVTSYVLGEVDALRFWETSIRPVYAGGGGGAATAPTIAGGGRLAPGGRVIPSCTPPPQTRVTNAGQNSAQHVYQSLKVETWVGIEDGLIRSERMTAKILPPIGDPKQMPDPIEFDAVFKQYGGGALPTHKYVLLDKCRIFNFEYFVKR